MYIINGETSNMKKITFIISSLNSGGAERVISLISKSLSEYYDVTIILLLNGKPKAYNIDKRVSIIELHEYSGRLKKWFLITLELHKIFMELNSDIYISFCTIENIVSLLANFRTKNKLIISERNAPKTEKKTYMIKILQKLLYHFADCIVFQTESAKSLYSTSLQKKGVVIPNPIVSDLPLWNRKNYLSSQYICAVGRLHPQKNYPLLFKAFKYFSFTYNNYKLLIFGIGSEEEKLHKLIHNLKLEDKIIMMGYHKDVHNYLQDCKFFVMPSKYEGMPNALMEAMSMGIPCISTNCPSGGPAQLISNFNNGILIENDNIDQLIHSMEFLVMNPEKAIEIGNNARKIKDKYNLSNTTFLWIEVIDKCLLRR